MTRSISAIYAQRRGLAGTPSFQFVRIADGAVFQLEGAQPFEQFEVLIDAILAGESPEALAEANAQESAGIPFWATPEGWAPDPDRPGYNMAGDQYKGSLDAPITMIEFSDFQCPYCKRHSEESQPILDEQFVDTGKVLWVFKHFPLDSHPAAPNAGAAAECAAEQGKFWEMHELIFAEQPAWSVEDPDAVLVTLAEQLGLDIDAFGACLIDPATTERVTSDLQEGIPFIRATPSFIVVFNGQGSVIQALCLSSSSVKFSRRSQRCLKAVDPTQIPPIVVPANAGFSYGDRRFVHPYHASPCIAPCWPRAPSSAHKPPSAATARFSREP